VPVQIHTMEDDEWGDADAAPAFAAEVPAADVFLYPGDRHLFTDNSLADYDEAAAALVRQRALELLARL
jgi:dienelactone hydrolase